MELTIEEGVAGIDPEQWGRLATGPSPFLEHAFLHALEASGSVGARTGWRPMFVTLHDGGELLGAVPAYVKSHSYGEYIFDWAWAGGSERAGVPYYPKLVVAVPFTPATGPRILLAPGQGPETAILLARAVADLAKQLDLSSVHWLFCTEAERDLLAGDGWSTRLTLQYHWRNQGWGSFEDFLSALKSKRRREIRRERRIVRDSGVDVRMLRGDELDADHWVAIEGFYRDTTSRKWGQAYLTPEFFEILGRTFAERVRFVAATQDGELIAGALNFQRDDAMFGRYWGCTRDVPGLHFECCYYAAIEHCISQGLSRYEAGAQGPHKIPRGFLASPTHSAHRLHHPPLAAAVDDFLEHEREAAEREIQFLASRSPFA